MKTLEEILEDHRHTSLNTLRKEIAELIDTVIGDNPDYGKNQPQYMQKIEAQVIKVKNAQRNRAKNLEVRL